MNQAIFEEKKAQADYWVTYKIAHFFTFFFWVILTSNGHHFVALIGIIGQIALLAATIPRVLLKFDQRIKDVTFKIQIENLYVYSIYEGQNDDEVVSTFDATIYQMRRVDNQHEVRIHLILFRDVQVLTVYWDKSGKLVKKRTWRETGSATESWENYLNFLDKFEANDRDERLRELRSDPRGFEWVNEYLFNQQSNGYKEKVNN